MIINDPSGTPATVFKDNRLKTTNLREVSYQSFANEQVYQWSVTAQDLGADKNSVWLRNDSRTHKLVIESVRIDAPAAVTIELCVGSGNTAGGTAVTGVNLSPPSGNKAEASCYHTNTNVDACAGMSIFDTFEAWAAANETFYFNGALALGYYGEFAVNVVDDIAAITVNIVGYFKEIDNV